MPGGFGSTSGLAPVGCMSSGGLGYIVPGMMAAGGGRSASPVEDRTCESQPGRRNGRTASRSGSFKLLDSPVVEWRLPDGRIVGRPGRGTLGGGTAYEYGFMVTTQARYQFSTQLWYLYESPLLHIAAEQQS